MRIIVFVLAIAMAFVLAACGNSAGSGDPEISVMEPWSRPSPMVAGNGAVYMMLMNKGGQADTLTSVSSDIAETIELHETKMEGDVMKMAPVQGGIEVPAGGSAELKPGGLHVMLINLKEELVPGNKIELTLNFENSDPIKVEAEIRDMGSGMDDMDKMEHEGHDMDEMEHEDGE